MQVLCFFFFNAVLPLSKGGQGVVLAQAGQKFGTGLNILSGTDALGSSNNFPLLIKTNSSEKMRITENGNVGIGITNPTDKLQVAGRVNAIHFKADSLLQALQIKAQSAEFAAALITGSLNVNGQISASSLIVSGITQLADVTITNAAINNQLTADKIIAPSAAIDSVNSNYITSQSITANTLNAQSILQNGNPLPTSQWISSGSNIYYNTGNIGIGTTTPAFKLSLDNDGGIFAKGTLGFGSLLPPVATDEPKLVWYPRKAAFRVGLGGFWSESNIGLASASFGRSNASGDYATSMGFGVIASGQYSFAAGSTLTASGYASVALGELSQATSAFAMAAGNSSEAMGIMSLAMVRARASGQSSVAIGDSATTLSFASNAIALGYVAVSEVPYSFTLGRRINNDRDNSLMVGFNNYSGVQLTTPTLFVGPVTDATLIGKVGIGTKTPSERLEVAGNIKATGSITASSLTVSGQTQFDSMRVASKMKLGSSLFVTGVNAPDGTLNELYTDNNGDANLYIQSNPAAATPPHAYNNNTIIGYNSTGNVGIGTTSPQHKLHVFGNGKFEDGSGKGVNIGFNSVNSFIFSEGAALLINYHFDKDVVIGQTQASNLSVNSTLIANGKVYINTTPTNVTNANGTHYELNVCGTIQSNEWVVQTGWCDFKLKPGYKRMTAEEKLSYILTYGHLPEMDPGSEIETNGLKVAKNLRGMAWNLEDNTMDIIDLRKENQTLKKEIDELKKQMQALMNAHKK